MADIVAKPVLVELEKINFAPYNPRRISDEKMRALKASIQEHGFVQPIVVQKSGMVLIAGHQRVRALRELCKETKQKLPPKVWATVLDVEESAAKKLNVRLNKISGEFDDDMLSKLLIETRDTVLSLENLGFSAEELDRLVGSCQVGQSEIDDTDGAEEDEPTEGFEDEWTGDDPELVDLKAPFPWFGGKSRVAGRVWKRFGDVKNYVEPFFGSGAVLLRRPIDVESEHGIRVETVNDLDCYVANFWRAVSKDAQAVAEFADWPVNEADLHARHEWLVAQKDFRERMHVDTDYFDAKIAGYWVWGVSCWIGGGWCSTTQRVSTQQLPNLGNLGNGIHRTTQQLPNLGSIGRGIHRTTQQLPCLGNLGMGILAYFEALQNRLRRVRVCCGDWTRVLGSSVTEHVGLTGIFFDPPYSSEDRADCYVEESRTVANDVRNWCINNGDNPKLRIALCGYAGEHEMPPSWECSKWSAAGGYARTYSRGTVNRLRERIWFSPHCLKKNEKSA